ncbi:rhamnogalacturonan-hydrolase [Gymnopilus junonius]|uniref:Rhamnogalacturonan-hydrolase n=1 Tax=Gymnopilus junonius TaxID=109634 RepID=A0A9P5P2F5_GYMJU|nr:rhamnogalacturonan-hydrolase [Gymnopilus junonius]
MVLSISRVALALLLATSATYAQLTGSVGPTSPLSSKRNTICSVLDYGGSIGSSDIGPAIGSASTLYVPPGNYNMQTWQTLTGGTKWAFQMDGVITRTGNCASLKNATDFEMYSSSSAGAIQGNGYQCRNAGPRLLRIVTSTSFSVHDLILVDSPEFHLIVQTGSNGELYNLAIRGTNLGGSDGIDISGDNHWVHDVEVTNRDECVTVKSPASNFLIENIWCNQSGGSAIGSLGTGTAIENIVYKNVYTNGGNQAFMIKSNGGSGYVQNVLFQNFISRGTAYGLNVNQYWSDETTASGNGVQLSNIQFENWDGEVVDGVQRPPIQFFCADGAPCTGMTLSNVNMWSATGIAVIKCESAYGSGACLKGGSGGSYAATTVSLSQPAGYTNPPSLSGDLSQGFATNSPIPIPTIPSTFYPGVPQISPLAMNSMANAAAKATLDLQHV